MAKRISSYLNALERLDEVCRKATPPPWAGRTFLLSPEDLEFISISREAMPALVDLVRALDSEADAFSGYNEENLARAQAKASKAKFNLCEACRGENEKRGTK